MCRTDGHLCQFVIISSKYRFSVPIDLWQAGRSEGERWDLGEGSASLHDVIWGGKGKLNTVTPWYFKSPGTRTPFQFKYGLSMYGIVIIKIIILIMGIPLLVRSYLYIEMCHRSFFSNENRKYQISTLLAPLGGGRWRWSMDSSHKEQVLRKATNFNETWSRLHTFP